VKANKRRKLVISAVAVEKVASSENSSKLGDRKFPGTEFFNSHRCYQFPEHRCWALV
jgi:hypothetical protein